MSGNSLAHAVNAPQAWRVLSWADWCERLQCSYVTAHKRVAAMVRDGQLQQLPVCPRCGRVTDGPACQCGRRFGRGPSYAYAAPGVQPCIKVPVHRRKYRRNYTGSPESPSIHRPNTDSRGNSESALPPYLNSDTAIIRALLAWGWTMGQVQDAQSSGLERWALVRAWAPVIHRMQGVRNRGGYLMACVKRGDMPQWQKERPRPQPVAMATAEERRAKYLVPVLELYGVDGLDELGEADAAEPFEESLGGFVGLHDAGDDAQVAGQADQANAEGGPARQEQPRHRDQDRQEDQERRHVHLPRLYARFTDTLSHSRARLDTHNATCYTARAPIGLATPVWRSPPGIEHMCYTGGITPWPALATAQEADESWVAGTPPHRIPPRTPSPLLTSLHASPVTVSGARCAT